MSETKKRRRGHGESSIYQRKDGRWVAVVDLGWINGKRQRKAIYGRTRREVADQLPALQADVRRGVAIPTARATVADFLDRWLEEAVKPSNAPRTHESYEQVVRKHLKPLIGKHRLQKLDRSHVQQMLNAKTAEGLSPRTVQYIRAVLRVALNDAIRWDLVSRNVAALAEPPRVQREEVTPLTADQVKRLFASVADDRLEAFYVVVGTLGLRRGEGMGLRWEDIDFEAGTLSVRQQVQRVGGKEQVAELKTSRSRRTLPMTPPVIAALKRRKTRQLEERLLAGSRWCGDELGLVFTSTIGTPLNGANLLARFHDHLVKAGLESADPDADEYRRYDLKALRHTAGTILALQGVHPRIAMEILGHSQIATTMNIYTHVVSEGMRDALASIDRALEAS